MGDLKVSVSQGKTVATLFDAEFPPLCGEGDLQDKLNLFKTMVYVKANILMCATHMTLKKDLFK